MLAGLQGSFPMFVKSLMRDYDLSRRQNRSTNLVCSYGLHDLATTILQWQWGGPAVQPCEERKLLL
jgi:hypothetical protein